MIDRAKMHWIVALALLAACDGGAPAAERSATVKLGTARPASTVPDRSAQAASRYTSIDPARCRLIERNIEEGGWSRHACGGVAGYRLEISDSDLRQDIVLIAPNGRRSELDLSTIVAKGAFNSLGKTAEWRGTGAKPVALIVRLNVAQGPEPTRPDMKPPPDISNLVVARLAPSACVVAVVPPGPGQNDRARRIADGKLPACLAP
jgi:hypothetical protein